MTYDRADVLVHQKPSSWRFQHSAWIIVVALGCGVFSVAGWAWAAAQCRSRLLWKITTGWAILTVLLWILIIVSPKEQGGATNAAGSSMMMICWLGSLILAFVMRRKVLKETALRQDELAQALRHYGEGDTTPAVSSAEANAYYGQPHGPARFTKTAPPGPLVESPAAYPSPVPTTIVDVNRAAVGDLRSLPSLDAETVLRILEARRTVGGFLNLDDLATRCGLQPHQVMAIQRHVSFGPFRAPESGGGRRLDF